MATSDPSSGTNPSEGSQSITMADPNAQTPERSGNDSIGNNIQRPAAVSGLVIPEYIGYPGAPFTLPSEGGGDRFRKFMEKTFHIATIRPLLPDIKGDANIYTGKDSWGRFTQACQANGISTAQCTDSELKVIMSQQIPLTETFTNEYGDSEILSGMSSMMGTMGSELAFVTGTDKLVGGKGDQEGQESITGAMKNSGIDVLAKVGEGIETGADKLRNATAKLQNSDSKIGRALGNVAGQLGKMANKPWGKIGWPQMWKNCSYSCSYELAIRLYCYNSADKEEYKNKILAPIGALQQFCCPQSEDGVLYEWPFMLELHIPGTVYIPLGYCSNMSIIKGGDVSHLALSGRPNIVDIRMTIQNVYGILVNVVKSGVDSGDRPTIAQEMAALYSGRNLGKLASDFLEGTAAAETIRAQSQQFDPNSRQVINNQKEAEEAFSTFKDVLA